MSLDNGSPKLVNDRERWMTNWPLRPSIATGTMITNVFSYFIFLFLCFLFQINVPKKCSRHHSSSSSHHKTESVLSTDSDIRFTRRKLGDTQKCGCVVIAGFLIFLLFLGTTLYVGCKYWNSWVATFGISVKNGRVHLKDFSTTDFNGLWRVHAPRSQRYVGFVIYDLLHGESRAISTPNTSMALADAKTQFVGIGVWFKRSRNA